MEHFFVHAEERAQHRPAYPREGVALRFGEEVQLVEAPRPAHRLEEPFAKPLRRVVHGFEVLRPHHAELREYRGLQTADIRSGGVYKRSVRAVVLSGEYLFAYRRGAEEFFLLAVAVVGCAFAPDSHRLDAAANVVERLDVLHGEGVVWRGYHVVYVVGVEFLHRLREGGGVAFPAGHQKLEVVGMHRVLHGSRGLAQGGNAPAFAAEAEHIDAAERGNYPHRALCEALGGAQAVLHGKLQHEVGAVFERGLCPGELICDCEVAALGEIPAHHGDDVGRAECAGLFELVPVSVVERIIFADNCGCFHKSAPFPDRGCSS